MPRFLADCNEEDLKEIQLLAALFFVPAEIALIREFNDHEFAAACAEEGSTIYKAFHSGRLQGEIDLRTGILKMSKAGSTPAQTMAMDLLNKSKLKLLS